MTVIEQRGGEELRGLPQSRVVCFSQSRFGWWLVLSILSIGIAPGCQRGPARVSVPEFDPDNVAMRVFEELNTNDDEALSQQELKGSPGLLASISQFDQDEDGKLTSAEIADRLTQWRNQKAGLLPLHCEVTWKGKPLKDATIRLVAEPFFDGTIPDASGVTDYGGTAELSCSPEDLPAALKSIRAVNPGIYRVEVTHPSIELPAKYNSKTTLGLSVSFRNSQTLILNL